MRWVRSSGGRGFGPQRPDTERTCSVLAAGCKRLAADVEVVWGMVGIQKMRWYKPAVVRSRGEGVFDPKQPISSART